MNTQYYLNNGDSSTICEIPEPNNDYFLILNNLSELETSILKKAARANLGIDNIVDSLNRKDKELERSLLNKADVADISNYMTTGDILPAVSSYLYLGDPISGIRVIQATETTVIFDVSCSDTNAAFYVVFEGNNIDGYTYQETYDESEGDEIPEYIKKAFGEYNLATTQSAGLMSALNVQDLNKLNNHAILDNESNRFTGYNIFRGETRFTNDVEFEDITAYGITVGDTGHDNVRILERIILVSDGVSIIPTTLTPEGVSSLLYHKWKDGIRYELATTEEASTTSAGLMSASDKTKLNSLDPYEDYSFEILADNTFTIEPRQNLLFDNRKLYILLEEISGQKTIGTMTGLIKVKIFDHNTVIGSTELFTDSYDVHSTDGVALSTLLNGNAMLYGASIELSADGHYVNGICYIR